MLSNRYYVTTAIPYVNARPHIGHAVLLIYADVLARYHRQRGDDTWSLTGTDDNSLTNVLAAEAEGVPVRALVDRNAASFLALREPLGLSFDDFIRTSGNPLHASGAEKLWRACERAGDVYRRHYEGLYCVRCERFYTPDELLDGRCPTHLRPLEMVAEENYFFRLSRYSGQLLALVESGRLRVVPETRQTEVIRFIRGGLQDFSISRSQARARGWGIPAPGDDGQVMYVWFDALCNYITALDYAGEGPLYRRYWLENRQRVHVIGKDLLRFHAVYWPAMLLSAGQQAPTTIYVHEFFTVNGQKISKSLGNAVDPLALVEELGTDGLRYCLLRELPRTEDTDLTSERLLARYDADLANGLGNLLQRTVSMVLRYRSGIVPACGAPSAGGLELIAIAESIPGRVAASLDSFDFRAALSAIWALVTRANRFVEESAPWTLAKRAVAGEPEVSEKMDGVLYTLAECLRLLGYHLTPFLPATSDSIRRQLGLATVGGSGWGELPVGAAVAVPQPLFPRADASVSSLPASGQPGAS
jgi:methionyl-tRNA synthetase